MCQEWEQYLDGLWHITVASLRVCVSQNLNHMSYLAMLTSLCLQEVAPEKI